MRSLRVVLGILLVLGLVPTLLFGQANATGTITGLVTDQTGSVVVGADVTIMDTDTNLSRSAKTNAVGRYTFTDVKPGTYNVNVSMKGFRQASVTGQEVVVGQSLTLNLTLEVGATTQTVEVRAIAGAELQTSNSTMGNSVGGNTLLALPNLNRDASSLLTFQPATAPTVGGGDIYGGQVAGSLSDQNTYSLDGGNATSDLEGDNAYTHSGRAAIPAPVESVQEFKVATNNQTADFASSAGGQVMLVTKRGSNSFHGSGYDYFQADWLNANTWTNNFKGNPKVKFHDNRFGGSVGGPMLPGRILGGKTYFYFNYQGRRFPGVASFQEWTVPSMLLRQGILQFDGKQYDLKTSTQCGAAGNLPCDPRGIGINPVVSQMWNRFEPPPNDPSFGDTLNTQGFRAPLALPVKETFAVGRVDHDFGDKWRAFLSYRYYHETAPSTNQIDIGGLLPGDKLGVPASVSNNPIDPRYFVFGLSSTLSPTKTNEFHLSYLRNDWQWVRAGVTNALASIPAGLEFADSHFGCMCPVNMDTQNSRKRLWNGHDWTYNDTFSWLKGKHFTQFGGSAIHWWDHHIRDDQVVAGLPKLVYQLNKASGLSMSQTYRPAGLPSNEIGGSTGWDNLYASTLGFVGTAAQLFVRGGDDFHLTGAQEFSDIANIDSYSLFFNDSWKVRPNLTINYGLEWGVQMPPFEINGVQDVMVDSSGAILTTQQYLDNRVSAAQNGQVYNPVLGFEPIHVVRGHPKYPFQPYYRGFSPRIAVAWSPNFQEGWLGKLFGHKSTVIRGGYSRIYDRNNGVDLVLVPLLGYGFGQTIRCNGAGINGSCGGASSTTPVNGFRLGVDGNVGPFPAVQQTLPIPAEPGVNSPAGSNLSFLDNSWRPGSNDVIDFSIQRQLPDNIILEVGYVGKWSKHLYQGLDLNDAPWMTTLGGQSFAQAYANLYAADKAGTAAGAQPFFEAALKGSSYCNGFASCTAAVLANEGSAGKANIGTQSVLTIWQDLDNKWTAFGPAIPETIQGYNSLIGNATLGFSNYQAGIVSLQKRTGHGLMMNANFTWSHTLSTVGINQEYTQANASVPFNLRFDYGPAPFDTRYVLNLLGTYELPFGKGRRFSTSNRILDRVIGGWSFAPIFTWNSGLVQELYTGSCQEFGQGNVAWCSGMVPLTNTGSISRSPNFGVVSDGNIGRNGDASHGGPGVNLFANPTAVYNSFRPVILGLDGRAYDNGPLYGQHRWNLDFTIAKNTRVTEHVGTTFYAQFLNAFNHMEFRDPGQYGADGLDLQNPHAFGVPISGNVTNYQFNSPRVISLGLRIYF